MMTPKQFKILLIQNDIRPTDICKEHNVTSGFMAALSKGRSSSKRIEKVIADACGMRREDIFPIIPEPIIRRDEAA